MHTRLFVKGNFNRINLTTTAQKFTTVAFFNSRKVHKIKAKHSKEIPLNVC